MNNPNSYFEEILPGLKKEIKRETTRRERQNIRQYLKNGIDIYDYAL